MLKKNLLGLGMALILAMSSAASVYADQTDAAAWKTAAPIFLSGDPLTAETVIILRSWWAGIPFRKVM